jgi:hypothetical protein
MRRKCSVCVPEGSVALVQSEIPQVLLRSATNEIKTKTVITKLTKVLKSFSMIEWLTRIFCYKYFRVRSSETSFYN